MRDHGPSREVLDVDRLERLVRNWPERSDTRRYRVVKDYQLALSRAIYISRYMRWFEARAERIRAGGPTSVVTRWWADEL